MKRTSLSLLALLLALMPACGGGGDNGDGGGDEDDVSGFDNRMLIGNQFSGRIFIMEGESHDVAANSIASTPSPSQMFVSEDGSRTLVILSTANRVGIINNESELQFRTINLDGFVDDLALRADGDFAFIPVRSSSKLAVVDLRTEDDDPDDNDDTLDIPMPFPPRRVSLTGDHLLVFGDNVDQVLYMNIPEDPLPAPEDIAEGIHYGELIDHDNDDDTPEVPSTDFRQMVAGPWDRPLMAMFSGDTAYVLNCGDECGGTQASVTELDLSGADVDTPPLAGDSVDVSGATTGLLDGTSLYVAGTPAPASGHGELDVVNITNMTVTTAGVDISDGYHHEMALGNGGKLYIAAHSCTNVGAQGCLSIFTTGSGTAVITAANGEVTGVAAVPGENFVYVAEGGELRIYDTTTDAPVDEDDQIDFVGLIFDVISID